MKWGPKELWGEITKYRADHDVVADVINTAILEGIGPHTTPRLVQSTLSQPSVNYPYLLDIEIFSTIETTINYL